MRFKNVCIEAFGYELPENIVPSTELEQRLAPVYDKLKLSCGRLELMTGIRERRFWNKGALPSEGSIKAGEKAIEKANMDREKLQCLIYSSVSRDFLEPATAMVVHEALKLPSSAVAFDVSNACLGVVNGIMIVANMIDLGQVQAGIIVSGEHAGPLVETTIEQLLGDPAPSKEKLKNSFASLTIGSGAVAVILTHADISKTGHRLLGGASRLDSKNNTLCRGGANHCQSNMDWNSQAIIMNTESEKLLQEGCLLAKETWADTKNQLGWVNSDVDRIFSHQVGKAHRRALLSHLEIEVEKNFSTFEYLGNIGSASLPVTMAIGIDQGRLQSGQKAAMLGIGSGIVCSMFGVEW